MQYFLFMMIDAISSLVVVLPLALILAKGIWKKNWRFTALYLLFVIYLAKMYDVVGVTSVQFLGWQPSINLIPFSDFGEAGFAFQVCANAVMFLPLGFLLPLLWKRYRSGWRTILAGFLTSFSIEFMQLFYGRATDVDDLLMNTLGAALGYLCIFVLARGRWKHAGSEVKPSEGTGALVATNGIVLLTMLFARYEISVLLYRMLRDI